eukprot:Sspe_Gene.326::Locus_115_Transcript_5_13_Confidence_0.312_Length_631::g.326::m.326
MLAGGQGLTEEYVRGNAELLWAELQVDVREDVTRGRTRRGGEGRVFTANIGEAAPVGGRTRPADARDERVQRPLTAGRSTYVGADEGRRYEVFVGNMLKAARLSRESGGARFGVNAFSDLTEEEFKVYHSLRVTEKASPGKTFSAAEVAAAQAKGREAGGVDWREKGAVT